MCGEHYLWQRQITLDYGSSPHVRGALCSQMYRSGCVGIIPACAGSTAPNSCLHRRLSDHPRMCGEHTIGFDKTDMAGGSSPHVRGAQ